MSILPPLSLRSSCLYGALEVEEMFPGLIRFRTAENGPQSPVNSYLWRSPDGWLLVDPSANLTWEQLPVECEELIAIFLTHVQAENAEGCLNFPGITVYASEGDLYLCGGEVDYKAALSPWREPWDWDGRGNYPGHISGAPNERCVSQAIKVEPLRADQTWHGLLVLETPGHGKNALTLISQEQEIAFCGDLIWGEGFLWNWFDSEWDYGLQTGQHALRQSALKLAQLPLTCLYPTHGPAVFEPKSSLESLANKLAGILEYTSEPVENRLLPNNPLNCEKGSPAPGFREVLPQLHQWRSGNCAVLLSRSGAALLIDDGLCNWEPLPQRLAHHDAVMEAMCRELNVTAIEWVIPTHYHGDHVENIPALVEKYGTRVLCLDIVAAPLEAPDKFGLACGLPWYGVSHETIQVDVKVPSGTTWRWHEYELEIFHLGGQTYYHAGIRVEIGGQTVIFGGDALSEGNALVDPILCYNDAEPLTRGWLYALQRLEERAADWIICGHGVVLYQPRPLLEAKRRAWETHIEQFRNLSARDDLRLFFDPFYNPFSQLELAKTDQLRNWCL